jgi:hypothetical protein
MFLSESKGGGGAGWLIEVGASAMAFLALGGFAGCASQGSLQPPSLHLPAPAQGLVALRTGDAVELRWLTPAKTTDGELLQTPVTATVCATSNASAATVPPTRKPKPRVGKHASATAAGGEPGSTTGSATGPTIGCQALLQLGVLPGASTALVRLAAEQTAQVPQLATYQVSLANANGRSAGLSTAAFAATGAAPPAVEALRLTAGRERVVVQWNATPGVATMELKRTLISAPAGQTQTAAGKPKKTPAIALTGDTGKRATEVFLRPDGTAGKDAGGMIDRTVRDGETYVYVAQRVRTVTLGGHTLEVRSAASAPVTIVYRDTVPPRAPTGLALIPGGGFGAKVSIDLSWDGNDEQDLLGYNIYRRNGAGDSSGFTRLNSEPVSAPAFRDLQVQAGERYTYRVTAVDVRHNESAPGAVVSESLRP